MVKMRRYQRILHGMVIRFSLLPQGRQCVRQILPWTGALLHGSPAPEKTKETESGLTIIIV